MGTHTPAQAHPSLRVYIHPPLTYLLMLFHEERKNLLVYFYDEEIILISSTIVSSLFLAMLECIRSRALEDIYTIKTR